MWLRILHFLGITNLSDGQVRSFLHFKETKKTSPTILLKILDEINILHHEIRELKSELAKSQIYGEEKFHYDISKKWQNIAINDPRSPS